MKPIIVKIPTIRLKGRAANLILNRKLSDWEDVKQLLNQNFGIEKSIKNLFGDLFKIKGDRYEKSTYNEIAKVRNKLALPSSEIAKNEKLPIQAIQNSSEKYISNECFH